MKKIIVTVFAFLLAARCPAGAGHIIQKDENLSLERCIEIALMNHPEISAARNTVDVGIARKGQAASGYYPQVDASAGYSRFRPATLETGGGTAVGVGGRVRTSHSFDQYSTSVTARQMLFDFGKTSKQVAIETQNIESSRSDMANTEEQIILNVKQAYFGLLRAKKNKVVAEETVAQFEQHLAQAKAFYEVGTKPKFDVTKAEVDLSNARLNLITAENALRIARVVLNNAMGVPDAPAYTLEDILSFQKYDIALEDAVARAYESRPELKSVAAQKKAAEDRVALAKTGYFPFLTGNASWDWAGERFSADDSGWSTGVTLSIPIFSGFLTKQQVAEAKANLNVIAANEEALRQNVLFEVQQAYYNLTEAEERIGTAALTERQALENFEIATGRYAAGVGNPIEVTDAEVSLSNAKTGHIQALYDTKVARASLEKAMGVR
jgi:outer membrane protein TolC